MKAKQEATVLEIKPISLSTFTVRVRGDKPLIMHKWSQKAMQEILDKQTHKTKTKARQAKDPYQDFIGSMYWMTEEPKPTEAEFDKAIKNGARFGFPATAFKAAAVSAAYRNELAKNKVSLQGSFFIDGEGPDQLVEIHYDEEPHNRQDMVKIAMGGTDIRFRGEFDSWWADLKITFNTNGTVTAEQIINLINLGGFCCGVGEWRPEKGGTYGMYHVEGTK
jgi:hypothetical protein